MSHLNVEIKARCVDPDAVREALAARGADFRGTDRQVDTYFRVPTGRLKLREGNIENALIFYHRPDQPGPKEAHVTLHHPAAGGNLKAVLADALGVKIVVAKTREIYFIGNVKFHIDEVDALGSFVEIEAIDSDGGLGADHLRRQCDEYMAALAIDPTDLVECSYSDMLAAT